MSRFVFTRRRMRGIQKSLAEHREKAARYRASEEDPAGRQPALRWIAPNLDRLVVVASFVSPPLKPGLIDRLLVMAEQDRLEALVVLNKLDLLEDRAEAERYLKLYRSLGYGAVATSTVTGEGLDELRERLGHGRSALAGHSGVGKSSLLQAVDPSIHAEAGEVSAATNKGKHTTTSIRLYRLRQGGELFDLPGLKLAPLEMAPEELPRLFPEFAGLRCRFGDCLHAGEPGCAVEEAEVDPERYASYRRMLDTLITNRQ